MHHSNKRKKNNIEGTFHLQTRRFIGAQTQYGAKNEKGQYHWQTRRIIGAQTQSQNNYFYISKSKKIQFKIKAKNYSTSPTSAAIPTRPSP